MDANGKPAAGGAEPGSGAADPAPGAQTGLNPAAPSFVPAAAQPQAESSAAPASASAPPNGQLPRQQSAGQSTKLRQLSRKRSLDDVSLQEQASPSKRAALDRDAGISTGGASPGERASAERAENVQPSADRHGHVGASIANVGMEVEPSAGVEPKCTLNSAQAEPVELLPSEGPGSQPALDNDVLQAGATALTHQDQPAKASGLPHGVQPADGAEKASATGDAPQQGPSVSPAALTAEGAALPNGVQPAGGAALHAQPSVASEEGELIAEMQAREDTYEAQAATDPAAANERLKKWQAGQTQQKADVQGVCNPEPPEQEAGGADELEAELASLDGPAQPKAAQTDPAVASERRRKMQQQLQALSAQKV